MPHHQVTFPLRCLILCLFIALGSSSSSVRVHSTERLERLTAVGRLWTTVRYGHPYLAYRDLDWDAALVSALPKIIAARDSREYAAAVQGLLDTLGDPATRVVDSSRVASSPADERGEDVLRVEQLNGVLVLSLAAGSGIDGGRDPSAAFEPELARLRKAETVIVDLRASKTGDIGARARTALAALGPALASHAVTLPAVRTWVHSGYRPQTGGSSGGYFSALQLAAGETITPDPGVVKKRVAFVLGPTSQPPPVAWALQRSRDAIVIAAGAFPDAFITPTVAIPLGEGLSARLRTGELISDGHAVGPDLVVSAPRTPENDPAMAAAFAFVRGGPRPSSAGTVSAATDAVWRPDNTYPAMAFPPLEYRILAAYRLWGTIDAFFPYKHLLSKPWQSTLPELITRMEEAKDAREYALAIAETATRMEDTHAGVSRSEELTKFLGEAAPPIALRYIEEQPVVVGILDAESTRAAGLSVGDVVLEVDGETAASRASRIGRYLAASNPGAHRNKISRYLLGGSDGSTAAITVRTGENAVKRVTIARGRAYLQQPAPRAGEMVRVLDGNIGYVDLARLRVPQVDQMFETLRDTRAIVFDMRGYPNGTAWAIAPRINTRNTRDAAMFLRPMLAAGSGEMKTTFLQPIPPTTQWKYSKPTIMMVDERTISQAEHTGLFFAAANGTTFVGSQTAGANGDVTRLTLPGGLIVGFTGHDVRHADGRQLQKVGLPLRVTVAPTIAGIRQGRDEVLERTLRCVEEDLIQRAAAAR